ncbi:MAG: SDR family NAD(P)-dependent oxidoreductase [Bacteroidota bacterium]
MKKTILITGSTDGIGKLAAIRLAAAGHGVALHGRNAAKLARVHEEVQAAAGTEKVRSFVADFSDLAAVRQMAMEVQRDLPQLDVLLNNAGVFKSPVRQNARGLDLRMVVNYLAPYLLSRELLPLLSQSPDPRLLNLSSAAQETVSLGALSGELNLATQEAYAQSKLALTMWSFHLAQRWSEGTVIAINPGSLLQTKMVKEAFGRFWSPAEKGSDLLYELAVGDGYAAHSGKYYDNDRGGFGPAHPDAYEAEKIAALLRTTEALL